VENVKWGHVTWFVRAASSGKFFILNNNNNTHICKAPYGRSFRGADDMGGVLLKIG